MAGSALNNKNIATFITTYDYVLEKPGNVKSG